MPYVANLRVYDNSQDVALGEAIPHPELVLSLNNGVRQFPLALGEIAKVPDWAKPLVEAAMAQGK